MAIRRSLYFARFDPNLFKPGWLSRMMRILTNQKREAKFDFSFL
ncbi:hypothetical protein [Spirulina major]|nr:hypothetical protein [Spirulina major]